MPNGTPNATPRWTVLRLAAPSVPSAHLGLLLVAEFTLVLWLRGMSIREYLASRDPVAGTVYYVMLGVFAIVPLLVLENEAAVQTAGGRSVSS